jgi:hypothetical protein
MAYLNIFYTEEERKKIANIDLKKILLLRGKNIFATFAKFSFRSVFRIQPKKGFPSSGCAKRTVGDSSHTKSFLEEIDDCSICRRV